MDAVKMGQFLSALRREHHLTQEAAGEALGVTNKTISRWETGQYLPPADMLPALAALYGVSADELLAGKRMESAQRADKAIESVESIPLLAEAEPSHDSERTLCASPFTLEERCTYYKKKWKRDHAASLAVQAVVLAALCVLCAIAGHTVFEPLLFLLGCAGVIVQRNRMMTYVERRAFFEDDKTPL